MRPLNFQGGEARLDSRKGYLRDGVLRVSLQKLVDGKWVETARAPFLDGAAQHAEAVGGEVRAVGADGGVLAVWVEGVQQ